MANDVFESKGTLFDGLFVQMFSKNVDLELYEYLYFRVATSQEMGISDKNVQRSFLNVLKENDQEMSFESFR